MDGIGRAALPGERNQVGGKTCDGTKLAEPSWQNQAGRTMRTEPEGRSDGLRR